MTLLKNRAVDYHDTYNKEVLPIFSDLEQVRLSMLNKFNRKAFLTYLLPIIIFTILWFVCYNITSNRYDNTSTIAFTIELIFIVLLPSALILMPIFYCEARGKENVKFTKLMKMKVMQSLLKVFGDIRWKGNTKKHIFLKDDDLNQSGLFISYNTRNTDDEFEGIYKDVPFKVSETEMFDIHGSGKHRTCACAFKGVVLSFKFNKKIMNRTVVATKGDLTKKDQALVSVLCFLPICLELFKGGYAHWKLVLSIIFLIGTFIWLKLSEANEEALDKVLLEDPKFAKRFNVYSSDQVEARYLVTTSFMQRFYDLKTAFNAKNIKCSFYDDKLMIAINTKKNLFEIGSLFKSLKDPTSINDFYREINSIYNMIDYFKLYEKTGL